MVEISLHDLDLQLPKKALVTGGCGFIGSNIAVFLASEGVKVRVLDDLSLGKPDNLKPFEREIEFIHGDVRDYNTVREAVKGCEVVFHEAARSSAPMLQRDPVDGYEVNVVGFLNVVRAMKEFSVKRLVYASTSSVYSKCKPPHREDMHVIPGSFYESSMLAREHAARVFYETEGLELVGLRYFSVYGPREQHKGRYANIVTQFLWSMAKDEPPVIFGDGTQTRDFVYVEDVVKANILAATVEGIGGEVFNVGTGKATTFNEVVEMLNEALGKDVKPRYVENPIKNYVYHTQADTSKAEKVLGFKASVSLKEGIEKIVEYYISQGKRA